MNLPIKKKKKKKICLTIFRQHFVLVKLEIPSSCTYQPNAANQYLGNKKVMNIVFELWKVFDDGQLQLFI